MTLLLLFNKQGSGGGGYSLPADAVLFALAGQDVALALARRLAADAGAFGLAGQDAALLAARRLVTDSGTFSLLGQDVGLSVLFPTLPPDGRVLAVTTAGRLVLLQALPREMVGMTAGRLVLLEALPRELAVRAAGRVIRIPAAV
jgi:hypothetical protein